MASVTITGVTKSFGDVQVLQEFSQKFEDGEFITLLGPSGCGKTTMLRLIAGFEKPTSGEIYIGDRPVSGKDNFVSPEKREIGMVFQSYAVWPHMNVYDNIAYPLKIKKTSKKEIDERVTQALKTVHLEQYKDRFPSELSGGQQQRVALGRALVAHPEILLLDEPLSNLDAKLRVSMRVRITQLHQELKTTMIYVTHDQVEAMTMGDRITVMRSGKIMQVDTPLNLYHYPANKFVAGFIGSPTMNLIDGELKEENGKIYFSLDGTLIEILGEKANKLKSHVGKRVTFGIRPENIAVTEKEDSISKKGKVSVVEQMGNEEYIYFSLGNYQLTCRMNVEGIDDLSNQKVEKVFRFDTTKAHIFDIETEENISL